MDRARIDNNGLTFQLLMRRFADEYADPYNPIHTLIHPRAVLRKVVDADRKVILRIADTYQQIEFETGAPGAGKPGPETIDETLQWIRSAYHRHYGRDVLPESVYCCPQPDFDFLEELGKVQISERLRSLGYIE